MEIVSLPQTGIRIKGKNVSFAVDAHDKASYNALLLLAKSVDDVTTEENVVVLNGPGEYEIGGTKISGTKGGGDTVYTLKVDNIEVLLGRLQALEKLQQKLKEHNVVVAYCDVVQDSAFLATLAANVIIFYGEKAKEVSAGLGKEAVKQMSRYQTTMDKLPPEVETIVLE